MKKIDELGASLREALESATAVAQESPAVFRHGAVLFKGRKILKAGCNEYRAVRWAWPSSFVQEEDGELSQIRLNNMHAEVSCMHNVRRENIRGSDILVVRINNQGTLMYSRPCKRCMCAMALKKVRRCYFSVDSETIGIVQP
jgi:tRNA(Arg) A34 adenosine deaminase TadA